MILRHIRSRRGLARPASSGTTLAVSGLTNLWLLDESSGTRSDSIGSISMTQNNNPSTATGLLTSTAMNTVRASLQFLRHDATRTPFNFTSTDSFTFGGWIKHNESGAQGYYCSQWPGGTNRTFALLRTSTNRVQLILSEDGSGTRSFTASAAFDMSSSSNWRFVVAYVDATNNLMGISVDGAAAETVTADTGGSYSGLFTNGTTGAFFMIGGGLTVPTTAQTMQADWNHWFKLNRAPTGTSEIASWYNGGAGIRFVAG